jgi:hypothetical protein
MDRRCPTCRHLRQVGHADKSELIGICHAAPPLIVQAGEPGQSRVEFPPVTKNFFCGFHRYAAWTWAWLFSGDVLRPRR